MKSNPWLQALTPRTYLTALALIGLILAVLALSLNAFGPQKACAQASCPVGSSVVFSGTVGVQDGQTTTMTIDVAGTTFTARTLSLPAAAANDTFVLLAETQTLTGKTLTAPAINGTVTTTGLTMPNFGLAAAGLISIGTANQAMDGGVRTRSDQNATGTIGGFENQSTGTSAGFALQQVFAHDGGVAVAGTLLRVVKNGTWTAGSATTRDSITELYAFLDGTARIYLQFDAGGDDAGATAVTNFRTNNATRGYIASNGGLVWGSATGGSQGAGTINAQSVFDDGVLLTDYVSDAYKGQLTQGRLQALNTLVPDRQIPAQKDEKGKVIAPARTEPRDHKPAADFAAQGNWVFNPKAFGEYFLAQGHLPQLLSEAEYASGKRLSQGEYTQRLMEIAEVLALQNYQLEQRVAALEGKATAQYQPPAQGPDRR